MPLCSNMLETCWVLVGLPEAVRQKVLFALGLANRNLGTTDTKSLT